MDRLADVRAAEQRVREETLGAFADEANVLEHALDLSRRMAHGRQLALDHTLLRAVLVSRAVGSLRCAWLSAAAGYRTQALTLARSALEDFATAAWVARHPADASLWLWEMADDLPKPERRPPRTSTMFDELTKHGAPDFSRAYAFLSEAAHPRAPGLLWNAQFGKGEESAKHSADLLPVYDREAGATCLHSLLLVAYLILVVAVELRESGAPTDLEETESLLAESRRVATDISDALGRIAPFVPGANDPDPDCCSPCE